jgi:hypothetical protein
MSILYNTLAVLRYWYYSLSYPKLRRLGFPALGLGLETRRRRCALYWEPHLKRCKATQRFWLKKIGPRTKQQLSILGAGKLYDAELFKCERLFNKIALLDADPLALPVWKQQRKLLGSDCELSFHIQDSTGILGTWVDYCSTNLHQLGSSFEKEEIEQRWIEALRTIAELPSHMPPSHSTFLELPKADAILSLNLLSQIPLVWQNALEQELIHSFGKRWTEDHEEQWLAAYIHSARRLVIQHLRDLSQSGAKHILLICDIDYCRYARTSAYSIAKWQPEPCIWTEEEGWIAAHPYNNGSGPIELEIIPALYDIEVLDPQPNYSLLQNYTCTFRQQWLWHISPLGIEDKNQGVLHRVGAYCFEAKSKELGS